MKTFRGLKSVSVFILICVLSICLSNQNALAIVTNDTATSESDPMSIMSFDWSGVYQYGTSGGKSLVAVGEYWVLSSEHYSISVGSTFSGNGTTYTVQEVVTCDDADLSLLRVDQALSTYYDIYDGTIRTGGQRTEVLMVGTGHSGTAYASSFEYDATSTRQLRWGTNKIDAVGSGATNYSDSGTQDYLVAGFTLNDTAYEAGLADHDSGGGWFVYNSTSGAWELAGTSVGLDTTTPPFHTSYAVDLRSYSTWINDTVATYTPEPATMTLLGAGALGLLLRRRRRS